LQILDFHRNAEPVLLLAPFIVPVHAVVAQADRRRSRRKILTRRTEEEKIAIICGRDAGRSYQDIGDELHERWESTPLTGAVGRAAQGGEAETARVIELTLATRRSTVIQVAVQAGISRETARLIRYREGYHD
jgi:hypothetical protein